MPRFRSLRARITFFFVILLITLQGVLMVLVTASGERIAKNRVADELLVGERIFHRLLDQGTRQLSDAARLLASDFGFRTAIATRDFDTIVSVLGNHGARIDASVVMLSDLDGKLLADTLHAKRHNTPFPFPALVDAARRDGKAAAIVLIDGMPYQIVVVPVLAPVPIAWVAMGFVMDDRVALDLQAVGKLHVSFMSIGADGKWAMHASTLPPASRASMIAHPPAGLANDRLFAVDLGGDSLQTLAPVIGASAEGKVVAVLQRSLREGMEPFDRLRTILLALALASVVLSVVGSVLVARQVTRPVKRLADVASRIRDGNYGSRAEVGQQDEIGELAASFNHMLDAISERESQILRLAYEDTLTGLPNRAMFQDRVRQALLTARRAAGPATVMLLDVDRFKLINEGLGHAAGDLVLREIGARLRGLLRESDTVARLGNDEFAILLPTGSTERADRVARRVLTVLEAPVMVDGQPVDVSVGIGIACYTAHDDDGDALLRHADVALYAAKRHNAGYVVYNPAYEQGRQTHLSLLGELRRAVEGNELSIHYQPKVDLQTGECAKAEALVRWIHPERGFIPPIDFIPFAEQTGYIKQVTRWVIEHTFHQVGQWHRDGLDVMVSVNISTRDLGGADLPELVAKQLAVNDLPPALICLEITESGVMDDPARALETLERLHALGLQLSVDDFGTGYSSLAYLKKLPVQEIKIDRSFVKDMVTNADDAVIVRSTIELGHNMGLKVVAEGVEDAAGLTLLRELGCDMVQGYVFSKPLPLPQFVKWLDDHNRRLVLRPDEAAVPA